MFLISAYCLFLIFIKFNLCGLCLFLFLLFSSLLALVSVLSLGALLRYVAQWCDSLPPPSTFLQLVIVLMIAILIKTRHLLLQ